jgi:hypothetical protein
MAIRFSVVFLRLQRGAGDLAWVARGVAGVVVLPLRFRHGWVLSPVFLLLLLALRGGGFVCLSLRRFACCVGL